MLDNLLRDIQANATKALLFFHFPTGNYPSSVKVAGDKTIREKRLYHLLHSLARVCYNPHGYYREEKTGGITSDEQKTAAHCLGIAGIDGAARLHHRHSLSSRGLGG